MTGAGNQIPKCRTGIRGLDEITGGGLPQGRPTLVCGGAGSGKTLFAMEVIVRGARDLDEPGVFVAFEETKDDLVANVASIGFDLPALVAQKKLVLDHVRVERAEIEETGEYSLEGLFVRLGSAIDAVGAKRVAIDSLEALFAGLSNEAILRAELQRLFSWIKQRGVTLVVTAERGREGDLTRHGIEEYVSDCVILLDQRMEKQVATRRLRILKYRGSSHGSNEYPTMIDETGLSVLPITSLGLDFAVSRERVSSGVAALDAMLGGEGFYRGSSVLVSGTAGTGKSSFAAAFADAACRRGERCVYIAYEEPPSQILRNMQSIGHDLREWVDAGRLVFHASRATAFGLEQHLVSIHKLIERVRPQCVIIDPVTNLGAVGAPAEITAMFTRVIDFLKQRGITALFTSLTSGGGDSLEATDVGISSLMDTWILLRQDERDDERRRVLYVLKSRGMAHSGALHAFTLSGRGIAITGRSQ